VNHAQLNDRDLAKARMKRVKREEKNDQVDHCCWLLSYRDINVSKGTRAGLALIFVAATPGVGPPPKGYRHPIRGYMGIFHASEKL
jgi:hypothetical protein